MDQNKQQTEKNRKEYLGRINKVIDYIEQNIDTQLSLKKLSDVANFSQFHFHRIFSSIIGETLNSFIRRKRLEKAASAIIANNNLSILDIAIQCGFSSSATFSRSFKEYFSKSPSAYKAEKQNSNIRKLFSNNSEIVEKNSGYLCNELLIFNEKKLVMKTKVEVKEMPELNVAYCRHIGPFNQIGKAYEKLMRWAGPRGLINFPNTKMLSVFHDDPNITGKDGVQQSACITVPENTKVDGEIGTMTVAGGKFAIARFEIDETQFQESWDLIMCKWLPESGYQCDDKLPYELYHNDHQQHPEKKFILDICVPVKPL
ncbi:MAG: AraC family transcriptional regulator [Bacteroidetes bacterium]|jgi:AraC family transcriptional regulator|nr:AraC family transcriptional regulator [Bacteroidota bacterium]MBT6685304.1 AraC family transcriptional regulator [Bacteroidota bacterium]MBT7143427.1 AraC family transcriptional regulator [Bacteroidota bacterium]MBT7491449.1 AraC family transcriptional regulator [Bacteroidota bacterium]